MGRMERQLPGCGPARHDREPLRDERSGLRRRLLRGLQPVRPGRRPPQIREHAGVPRWIRHDGPGELCRPGQRQPCVALRPERRGQQRQRELHLGRQPGGSAAGGAVPLGLPGPEPGPADDGLGRRIRAEANGNNNAYDVDSVATWNNYTMIDTNSPDTVATGDATGGTMAYANNLGTFAGATNGNFPFLQYLLQLRAAHAAFRQQDYKEPVTFTNADGTSGFNEWSN